MNAKMSDVGTRHVPTTEIENRATVTTYDTRLYINTGSHGNEIQQLRNHPAIRDFASVKPDTYELIKATNPTLLLFIDLAKRICEVEG